MLDSLTLGFRAPSLVSVQVPEEKNRTGARNPPPAGRSKPELGRGERVMRGVYRLRLPLPWPGVPHCNAWAVSAGDGVVLFDTGMHQPGSLADLERAMAMCGLVLEDVRLLVCTHAHSDHYGQAATIVERTGCELWMHPNHAHMSAWRRTRMRCSSGGSRSRARAVCRRSRCDAMRPSAEPSNRGSPASSSPIARSCRASSSRRTGPWQTYETPGHAPSHVCLFQPERRLLISGDHLLGRVSPYFDYGYTPDPVGEFLSSLTVVEALGARLCLAGHGRTFADVQAHIEANRDLVHARLERTLEVLGEARR